MTVGNKVTAYRYNKNDELLRTDTLNTDTEEDSVVIYKNDKNGNQLATINRYEIPSDKKDSAYVDIDVTLGDNRLNENVVNHYNALNQLTQTLTKNYKVSFTYDAEGLRTSKTVNGEKTIFVWDGDQLVLELSEGGKVKNRYIRGNDLVYTDKGNNTEKKYYVTDPHGNVVQLTDESGKVVRTYEYDSFGNEVKPDSKDDNPFRYCGEYYDKETGEIYLRARYYQPNVGRFLTRDTYTGKEDDLLSLHLYTYCGNDGVNTWDPSGYKYVFMKYSGFTVDFDGSPHAYAPEKVQSGENKGKKNYAKPLDKLGNAGKPGNWWALVTDREGNPIVRDEIDKKGRAVQYYVSATSLKRPGGDDKDQNSYVNASKIPYIVTNDTAKLGRVCLVVKKKGKKVKSYSFAIVADYNSGTPSDTTGNNSGEGSSKLLKNLGGDGKKSYFGAKGDKFYVYIFNKKVEYPWTVEDIKSKGKRQAKINDIKYKKDKK